MPRLWPDRAICFTRFIEFFRKLLEFSKSVVMPLRKVF